MTWNSSPQPPNIAATAAEISSAAAGAILVVTAAVESEASKSAARSPSKSCAADCTHSGEMTKDIAISLGPNVKVIPGGRFAEREWTKEVLIKHASNTILKPWE